jgi:hypothetical protein
LASTATTAGRALLDRVFEARRVALLEPLDEEDRQSLATMLERLLAARTTDVVSAKHLCRLCERRSCPACPVAAAARGSGRASPQG